MNAAAAAAIAPALTNADPKCGMEISSTAATKATASQVSAVNWKGHIKRAAELYAMPPVYLVLTTSSPRISLHFSSSAKLQ